MNVAAWRAALDAAELFALRPANPGLLVFDTPGGDRWVAVFTSLDRTARFARARGHTVVDWMCTAGADLISQLPPHVGLVVDPGEEHCVVVPASWLSSGADPEGVIDPLSVNSRT